MSLLQKNNSTSKLLLQVIMCNSTDWKL